MILAGGKYILKNSSLLEDAYDKHKDEDGFLYLVYTDENIYGHCWSELTLQYSYNI